MKQGEAVTMKAINKSVLRKLKISLVFTIGVGEIFSDD